MSSALSSPHMRLPTQTPPSLRRISQHITDIVTGSISSKNKTHSPPSPPLDTKPTELSIEIEGGHQLIIRPNRIARGCVVLNTTARVYATQIRIKFRAEEMATVKVREPGLESKIDRIDQITTTYFEVDSKIWGNETSEFSLNPWKTLEPGEHRFEFALKVSNSQCKLSAFYGGAFGVSIRYIWSAHLDAPSFHPGIRSKCLIVPYRPILCAPVSEEWTYSDIIYKDRKTPSARVHVTFPQQVYCPDEIVNFVLEVDCIPSDLMATNVIFTLQKHHEGKLLLQKGTAHKTYVRLILHSSVPIANNKGRIHVPIQFQIPTRLVSPSFASRHLRVYYHLVLTLQFENFGSLLKSTHTAELMVPIGIANLPHDHLLRIPELTSVQSYESSREAPLFFDPSLDEPPAQASIPNELWGSLTAALVTPPNTSPPNYFSIPSLPPQLMRRERVERTVFTSRLVKSGFASELGEPIVLTNVDDDEW